MLNNIHPNIHNKFNVFKKQNSSRIAVELEEEEEAGSFRDRTAKKELHKYHHPSFISSP
jgi:hypothetical protein